MFLYCLQYQVTDHRHSMQDDQYYIGQQWLQMKTKVIKIHSQLFLTLINPLIPHVEFILFKHEIVPSIEVVFFFHKSIEK
jgi:hypothetical protein